MAKVDLPADPDGCWIWTGSLRGGYGQIRVKTEAGWSVIGAHRVSFELHRGPIPDGLEPDHLCRNTECVNPAHLEPVTHRENLIRGLRARGRLKPVRTLRLVVECAHCSASFVQLSGGRRRRFCGNACRIDFHNARRAA